MRKRNNTKASGSNDALFGGACLAAIIALGLCSTPAKAEEKAGPNFASTSPSPATMSSAASARPRATQPFRLGSM